MIKIRLQGAAIVLGAFLAWSLASWAAYTLSDSLIIQALVGSLVALCGAMGLHWWLSGTLKPSKALQQAHRPQFWALVAIGLFLAFIAGQALGGWAYSYFGSPGLDANQMVTAELPTWTAIIVTVILGPLTEEALFRGTFYAYLRTQAPAWESTIIVALGFALIHGNIIQALVVAPLSFITCFAFEASRQIWPSFIIHAVFNAASFLPAALLQPFMNLGSSLILLGMFLVGLFSLYALIGPELEKAWKVRGRTTASAAIIGN